jgi:hypothetical protein
MRIVFLNKLFLNDEAILKIPANHFTLSFPGIDYNGGDRMDNLDNIYLGDALSLVPQGFKTVAIFPPFAQAQ